jgi:hypothetical protein
MAIDHDRGRQFVSQLGALAEDAGPQSEVLSHRNSWFPWGAIKFLMSASFIPSLSRYCLHERGVSPGGALLVCGPEWGKKGHD